MCLINNPGGVSSQEAIHIVSDVIAGFPEVNTNAYTVKIFEKTASHIKEYIKSPTESHSDKVPNPNFNSNPDLKPNPAKA